VDCFSRFFPSPKTGADAGAHRRHCRRGKSGVGGVTGYASRRRVCGAALRAGRARGCRTPGEQAWKSKEGYVYARKKIVHGRSFAANKTKRKRKNERGDCPAPVSSAAGASVTLREAKPVRLRCLEREDIAGEIVWTAGPWRSSGDWSEQEGWSREEWDIASCQLPVPSPNDNWKLATTRVVSPGAGQAQWELVCGRNV
jgi:hypothetical protein